MCFEVNLYTSFNMLSKRLQMHQMKVGAPFWGLHCKKSLVKARKQIVHKFPRVEDTHAKSQDIQALVLSQTILVATDNTTVV